MRNGGRGRKKDRWRYREKIDRERKRGQTRKDKLTIMRRKDVKINVNCNITN